MLVQAENDELEVAEVIQSIVEAEDLNEAELKKLSDNLHIYCSWGEGGEKFAQWLGARAKEHNIDIAFVDPVMSFSGCDVVSNKDVSEFLRQGINPQLKAPKKALKPGDPDLMSFGLIVIHHTPKDTKAKTVSDVTSYDMLGASELTNWARFIMHIYNSKLTTVDQRVFDVVITKRGNRSGMKFDSASGKCMCTVQHSSKKGIKPVDGKFPKRRTGTGLNWIHWEEYKPANATAAKPQADSAPKVKSSARAKKLTAPSGAAKTDPAKVASVEPSSKVIGQTGESTAIDVA